MMGIKSLGEVLIEFCAAVPRFIGCFDSTPCVANEISYFTEGEDIRFNISVGYIPGGPSGMQQSIRFVTLQETDLVLANCLDTDLDSCIVNPALSSLLQERFMVRRDESDPWFDIEINITNAITNDNGAYSIILEADDLSSTFVRTQSTSIVTVSVTPTPSLSMTPTSIKQMSVAPTSSELIIKEITLRQTCG